MQAAGLRNVVLTITALVLVLAPVSSAAKPKPKKPPRGSLVELRCVADAGAPIAGCIDAHGLRNTAFLAFSPDGRFVYATARDSDAVAVFRRDARTGALSQLPGAAGCVLDGDAPKDINCPGSAAGLDRASAILVSRDGRNVYVAGNYSNAIAVFAREASGALRPMGCITDRSSPERTCDASGAGLRGVVSLALSPDGRFLYSAAHDSGSLAGFARDPATGALKFLACVAEPGLDRNCSDQPALKGLFSVAVASDGRGLYAAARDVSAVLAFRRDPGDGSIKALGCISGDAGYRRDPRCASGRGIQYAQWVTVSPDGRFVYASATDSHTIGVFARNRTTGALTQLRGRAGCLHDAGYPSRSPCAPAVGMTLPLAFALTRDGRFAYVAGFGYGEVTAFARNVRTGALKQLGKCISDTDPRCPGGKALTRAGFVALSPDERHVYVNAPSANAIAIFGRRLR
jgi:6-phosphogluconolactonase (cycloisomerase 2 family)